MSSPGDPDNPYLIKIRNREDLIFVLCEASTLEHMIMCEYLFAAFSIKRNESEGLTQEQLDRVKSWERVITSVAIQEMTHLALVNNMLVSIGSSPYFLHSNFPQPSRYFSPNFRLALIPFGEQALRHFLYLERPEGMSIQGVPGFEVLGDLNPSELRERITPQAQYFTTVGNLYRGIEKGFKDLVSKYGEEGLFIGAGSTQATEDLFGLEGLFPVKDLASAVSAVEAIVEMGEGARGKWENAHFGKFLRIYKEFMEMKKNDLNFHPTKPVVAAYVRPPQEAENLPLISDPFTAELADLFNATYSLLIEILARFYVHGIEHQGELQSLVGAAVGMMISVIKPLGIALTDLPVGNRYIGLTAGPTFELQHREYVMTRRDQAFMILQERSMELAEYAQSLSKEAPLPSLCDVLKSVAEGLTETAKGFQLQE